MKVGNEEGFQEEQLVGGIQYLVVLWSVPKSCLTLCDPMDCSTPGFPVLHYLSEFAPIHVH